MKQVQQGFTLIELMIVVAIIGILAAVAIPAYQDYTIRSRVTEGLSLASAAKTGVSEYFATNGTLPANNTEAGLSRPASIKGNSVQKVEVNAGTIEVTFVGSSSGMGDAGGKTLFLTPATQGGAIAWDCTSGGNLQDKFRPGSCR
jgi:type IV pilus assembly protein PilA